MRYWWCLFFSCAGSFPVEFTEVAEASIEGTGPIGSWIELVSDLGFDSFTEMDISNSQELQNQGVAPGDIESAHVTDFVLRVVEPSGGDLSFLSSLEIWVEAQGLDPILVAHNENFPEGQGEVHFTIENVDLVDYVVSDSMNITTNASGRAPVDNTTVEASVSFVVDVTAQGACKAVSQ